MNAAAGEADAKVLPHPTESPAVVRSSNHVVTGVRDFRGRLGIESGRQSSETRRRTAAAAEVRDKALETGAKGVDGRQEVANRRIEDLLREYE